MQDTPLADRLADITTKLRRARFRRCAPFGASQHGLELEPPLPEDRVAAFEAAHGVTLPPDFRAFLTTVGARGAGPYYGLHGLDRWDDFVEWINDEAPPGWLTRPSPLKPGANPLPDQPGDEDDEDDEDALPPDVLAAYQGTIALGSRGCTYATLLVITGPMRGRVVYVSADGDEPPYVCRDPDFVAWYTRWLDEMLEGYTDSWFGYGPAGGEATLRAIIERTDDGELRREAAANLHKLPALSADLWPALAPRLRTPDPSQATLVSLFAKAPPTWADAVASALDAADPAVRSAACRALMALDPEGRAETIWARLLSDPAPAVRQSAFHGLSEAGAIDDARLQRLLRDPEMGRVRHSALRAMKPTAAHTPLLAELLVDPDSGICRQAAYALRDMGADALTDEVRATVHRNTVARLPTATDEYARAALVRLAGQTGNRAAADLLLAMADDPALNDFEHLDAVQALIAMGEPRASFIARRMLGEHRTPTAPGMGHTRTIATLVAEALKASPSEVLRGLKRRG